MGVALVAFASSAMLPFLGLASAALLFLLPVLFAATRSGLGPGLFAALAGATAYNFFLLPPRFTFRVHGLENAVSVLVLTAVAMVTSRLATQLKVQQAEAEARAKASEEATNLAAALGAGEPEAGLASGILFLAQRYGDVRLMTGGELPEDRAEFSSLDLSAAAWAMHNGDTTGHGTDVMAAADWTFLPLGPAKRHAGNIAAVARPVGGETRSAGELHKLHTLVQLLGQGWDRAALETERRARERLQDSDRLRKAFLSSLAHDFRTPLTVVTGELEELRRQGTPTEHALLAARRLDRMMNDLLGAARLDEGALVVAVETVDVIDLADAALEGIFPPEGIALERSIPADLPFVRADPVLMRHVLGNLLDNALRHARTLVRLSAARDGKTVVLSVNDDGPGIAPEHRAHVFDQFATLDGSDRASGSGLGLAIVKGFTEAMGGSVALIGSSCEGGQFTVTLPSVGEECP